MPRGVYPRKVHAKSHEQIIADGKAYVEEMAATGKNNQRIKELELEVATYKERCERLTSELKFAREEVLKAKISILQDTIVQMMENLK